MSELTDATTALTTLIASYGQTRDELVAAMTTPVDGGQNGDGWVNVTLPNGEQVSLQSLLTVYDHLADAIDTMAINRLISHGRPDDSMTFTRRR